MTQANVARAAMSADEIGYETAPADHAGALLSGADVGLALFDSSYRLTARNDVYLKLCGLNRENAPTGITLMDLARHSMRSRDMPENEIEDSVDTIIRSLRPSTNVKSEFRRVDGASVEVSRTCTAEGSIVETVREVEPGTVNFDRNLSDVVRARLDRAMSAMSDGFVLYDADDRLVLYNRQFLDIYPGIADVVRPGVQFREIKRRMIERGLLDTEGLEPEAFLNQLCERHRTGGASWESKLADGRWILARERASEDGGVVGTRTDISEIKQRELALQEATQRIDAQALHFNTALENMNQGLCMFDADNVLIVANKRYREIYGFSADVVTPGATLREILEYSVRLGNYTPEEAERALEQREARRTLRERTTIKQRLKDGRVIAVMNEPMQDGGSIATYLDVSQEEQHEAELRAYTAKLEASNRELQDFAYVASHDLQEPLRKIETFGDRLANKHAAELSGNGPVYIEKMQDAAGRMRRLINDLLGYSRVTTKAKSFEKVALGPLVEGVLGDLSIRIEEQGARVEITDMPTIMAEPTQMRQVVQNLIANALKFVRPDVPPVIRVGCEVQGDHAVLCIADNGIGFDNAFKDQIFTIFQRLHGRLEYEGTGIGLATVRKIVERHHGTIDADGRVGEGATFTVTLPLRQEEEA